MGNAPSGPDSDSDSGFGEPTWGGMGNMQPTSQSRVHVVNHVPIFNISDVIFTFPQSTLQVLNCSSAGESGKRKRDSSVELALSFLESVYRSTSTREYLSTICQRPGVVNLDFRRSLRRDLVNLSDIISNEYNTRVQKASLNSPQPMVLFNIVTELLFDGDPDKEQRKEKTLDLRNHNFKSRFPLSHGEYTVLMIVLLILMNGQASFSSLLKAKVKNASPRAKWSFLAFVGRECRGLVDVIMFARVWNTNTPAVFDEPSRFAPENCIGTPTTRNVLETMSENDHGVLFKKCSVSTNAPDEDVQSAEQMNAILLRDATTMLRWKHRRPYDGNETVIRYAQNGESSVRSHWRDVRLEDPCPDTEVEDASVSVEPPVTSSAEDDLCKEFECFADVITAHEWQQRLSVPIYTLILKDSPLSSVSPLELMFDIFRSIHLRLVDTLAAEAPALLEQQLQLSTDALKSFADGSNGIPRECRGSESPEETWNGELAEADADVLTLDEIAAMLRDERLAVGAIVEWSKKVLPSFMYDFVDVELADDDTYLSRFNDIEGCKVETLPGDISAERLQDLGTCTVCLCEFEPGGHMVVLPCSHAFHGQCIGSWFGGGSGSGNQGHHLRRDRETRCPNCREQVITSTTQLMETSDMHDHPDVEAVQIDRLAHRTLLQQVLNCSEYYDRARTLPFAHYDVQHTVGNNASAFTMNNRVNRGDPSTWTSIFVCNRASVARDAESSMPLTPAGLCELMTFGPVGRDPKPPVLKSLTSMSFEKRLEAPPPAGVITTMFSAMLNLRFLNLSATNIEEMAYRGISQLVNLRILFVVNSSIDDNTLSSWEGSLPNLRFLDCSHCYQITDAAMAKFLVSSPRYRQRLLHFRALSTHLGTRTLFALSSVAPRIRTVHVHSMVVSGSESTGANAHVLNTLRQVAIEGRAYVQLVRQCKELEHLLVFGPLVTDIHARDMLPHIGKLRELRLYQCSTLGQYGLKALVHGCSSSLRYLEVSLCGVDVKAHYGADTFQQFTIASQNLEIWIRAPKLHAP